MPPGAARGRAGGVRGRFPRTGGPAATIGGDGGHLHYFTFADIRALLHGVGFERVEECGLYRWTTLTRWGRMKEAIKRAVLGDRLKREFCSGAVVVRATRGAGLP